MQRRRRFDLIDLFCLVLWSAVPVVCLVKGLVDGGAPWVALAAVLAVLEFFTFLNLYLED